MNNSKNKLITLLDKYKYEMDKAKHHLDDVFNMESVIPEHTDHQTELEKTFLVYKESVEKYEFLKDYLYSIKS